MSAPTPQTAPHVQPQYWVGVDLGTTHTVVAFRKIASEGAKQAHVSTEPIARLAIPQWVAAGRVEALPLLPCFRYHPPEDEFTPQQLALPWKEVRVPGDDHPVIIGEWARELSSKTEGRTVVSAKSWLSNSQVDRVAPILPWGADETSVKKISPLTASASYLAYIHSVWNHQYPDAPLADQKIVITIPASFDEMARALTLEAARFAGLSGDLLLLEEPQAVCYDWIVRQHFKRLERSSDPKENEPNIHLLLVCDIGGGTTDLSLIQVDGTSFTRVGVGDHLMLGGDNIDLALAHIAEQRLVSSSSASKEHRTNKEKRFSVATLSQLLQQTRRAKEALLAEQAPEHCSITVLGRGASLIAASKKSELSAEEVRAQVLDGFFARCEPNAQPKRRRSGVVELGLPYEVDPAITKHIADFLSKHQAVCRVAYDDNTSSQAFTTPDAIIFNGGLFKSPIIGQRLKEQFEVWGGRPVVALENPNPESAVAYGAVAYSMARAGAIRKIGGGSARSFLLKVEDAASSESQAVCLLPRGTEASETLYLSHRRFALRLGVPVSFHLLSTTCDQVWSPGEVVPLDQFEDDELISLPPLVSALESDPAQAGGLASPKRGDVEVSLAVVLNEVGTIDLECVSCDEVDPRRWRLEFQLRSSATDEGGLNRSDATEALPKLYPQARQAIGEVFGKSKKRADPKSVKLLRAHLEKWLDKRDRWSFQLLRALADDLLPGAKHRRRSEQHERLWFNLMGFTLRPGFGDPLDEWRLEQVWALYRIGLQFDQASQMWSEWWTFWRRISGGLSAEQQTLIFNDVAKYINPAVSRNRKVAAELKGRSYEDIVRLVGSLENLAVDKKVEMGLWLLKRLEKPSESDVCWWALGRLGARVPFYGSAHSVVAPGVATAWLVKVLDADWLKIPMLPLAATLLARKSGDRARDVDDHIAQRVIAKLEEHKCPPHWVSMVAEGGEVEEGEEKRMYGDALPAGLKLVVNHPPT